ncbi:hypothetical protein ABFX02_08G162800 [Erythranthe guttata]
MDNQDQEYGGGGARKEGEMDGDRRKNVGGITISDETTAAEEEAVHGGASGSNRSSGGTINQDGIVDLTGSPPETAGSNRAVSVDDGRTLNLIESLPETTAGGRLDSVGNPGSALTPAMRSPVNRASSSSRLSLRPLHLRITHLIKDFQDSERRRRAAGGGGESSRWRPLGKGKGKAAAVDQHSFIPNYFPPLDGHEDQPPFKKLNIGGGGGYSQTSAGVGGSKYIQYSGVCGSSSHNNSSHQHQLLHGGEASAPAAAATAALPPRPPRPRDGYSQTSGAGGGGSGHNSSIAEAATIAALPPQPPEPRIEFACMFCKRARFWYLSLLEQHIKTCIPRHFNLG